MNRTDRTTAANWQIADAMTHFSADGHKLSTVRNYDPRAGYLDVNKGFLFTSDFYVPVTAVAAVDDDGIELNLARDEVESGRYANPPRVAGGGAYSEPLVTEATAPGSGGLGRGEGGVEDDPYVMHTADGRRT